MKTLKKYIGSQFGNPRGFIGKVCCFIMNTINKAMYLTIISAVKADCKSKILEIGYGNGYLIQLLYKKTGATIYGIDSSSDMLEIAGKRNRKVIAKKKIHLSVGDCCNLKFQDKMFDIVTSVNTIYFWSDPVIGLSEIYRTLKENGVFYNVVYSKEWLQTLSYTKYGFHFFEKRDYIELGKKAGFSQVSIKEIASNKSYMIRYIK